MSGECQLTPRSLLRVIAPGSAALLLVFGAVTSAQAGPPPGWRIVKQLGPAGATKVASVTAANAGDAWAAGVACGSPCATQKLLVERYGKGKWSAITGPAGLTSPTVFLGAELVAASSASDAWVYALLDSATSNHTDALHWTGKGWRVTKFPAFSQILTAADFSAKNAWAFGMSGSAGGPFDEHFNGKGWHHVTGLPGNPEALSAVSASDMWALGPTMKTATKPINKRSLVLMHWDGKKWHSVGLPKIALPAGDYQVAGSIAATSASNVWEAWAYGNAGTCCLFGGLEHLSKGKWHAVTVSLTPAPVAITGIAQDGHGGVWLSDTPASGGRRFDHYSGGKWSDQLAPQFLNVAVIPGPIAWIPGTRSEWDAGFAIGTFGSVSGTVGELLKQGN
jgi:hypothetical protein